VTEILTKERFSIMVVLVCILGGVAHGWQSGIIRIRKEHTSEALQQQ